MENKRNHTDGAHLTLTPAETGQSGEVLVRASPAFIEELKKLPFPDEKDNGKKEVRITGYEGQEHIGFEEVANAIERETEVHSALTAYKVFNGILRKFRDDEYRYKGTSDVLLDVRKITHEVIKTEREEKEADEE